MSRRCLVCARPDRADIDGRLASGAACSGIARAIGVSADSVERHRNAHLPAAVLASQGAAEAARADALLARVESLGRRMEAMLGRAELAGDVKNAAAAPKA